MVEIVLALLALAAVSSSYLAGQLKACKRQLAESTNALSDSRLEAKGYLNRLLEKHGVPVVFDNEGNILTETPNSQPSPPSFIRPPFAAAEIRWDEEEEEASRAVPVYNPMMSQAEKEAMLSQYVKNEIND